MGEMREKRSSAKGVGCTEPRASRFMSERFA
jgi:hypothetical protein